MPWLCIGDFNKFLWQHEKDGGLSFSHDCHCNMLEFLNANSLTDLGFQRPKYTWRCFRNNVAHIQERLDRAVVNDNWLQLWPEAHVLHGCHIGSDHRPLTVELYPHLTKRARPFRFESYWVEDDECGQIIHDGWEKKISGGPAARLVAKLGFYREFLKT